MTDQESLRAEIYRNMDMRDTDELTDIWQEHDTSSYTQLAFDAISHILLKRLGSLPPRDDDNENDRELRFERTEFPQWDEEEQQEIHQACPFCKSENVFSGEIVTLSLEERIVLKSRPPEGNSDGEMGAAYNELVTLACEECGHVFFMLKDFLE